MKETIKIPRALLSSFLMNVDKSINHIFPENTSNIINAISQISQIKALIKDQDESNLKKNKFKQLNLL